MAREGIYVGSNEVIQRYVGTRLVWEKILFPFYTQTQVIYKRSSPFQIYFNTYSRIYRTSAKRIKINGHVASASNIVIEGGFTVRVNFQNYNDLLVFWRDILGNEISSDFMYIAHIELFD